MRDDRLPQDLANRPRPGEEGDRAVEILRCELAKALDGVAMNALVCGREGLDGSGALDVRRLRAAHREITAIDPVAHIRVTLRKVPRQFTQRTASRVRSEVVLCRRQRLQQPHRACRVAIPPRQKHLEFVHDQGPPHLVACQNYLLGYASSSIPSTAGCPVARACLVACRFEQGDPRSADLDALLALTSCRLLDG